MNFNFGNLKKVDCNTKVKLGDFYDSVNDVYYNAVLYDKDIFGEVSLLIPNGNSIETSKNTKSLCIDNYSLIFTIMLIIDGMLVLESALPNYRIITEVYDENTLNYLLENQLLKNYSDISNINSLIAKEKILPDIKMNFRLEKIENDTTLDKLVYGERSMDSLIIKHQMNDKNNLQQFYSLYRQELSKVLEDYKAKKKALIRF